MRKLILKLEKSLYSCSSFTPISPLLVAIYTHLFWVFRDIVSIPLCWTEAIDKILGARFWEIPGGTTLVVVVLCENFWCARTGYNCAFGRRATHKKAKIAATKHSKLLVWEFKLTPVRDRASKTNSISENSLQSYQLRPYETDSKLDGVSCIY